MSNLTSLAEYLLSLEGGHDSADKQMAPIITALSEAAQKIAARAASNGIGEAFLGALAGGVNEDGDSQKQLDVLADELVTQALRKAGAGAYYSEEQADVIMLDEAGLLGVACDPLDGSSNIDTNLTIGTIFSLFARADCTAGLPPQGRKQKAAGIFIYGPQTTLLLRIGDEMAAFALSGEGVFQQLNWQIEIPPKSQEFAINASNAAFWPAPIQAYIHEVSYGAGALSSGMRWCGSLVADAFRIFRRGGVFLYPQDSRKGYEQGRLRLIYEAAPIAYLIEGAGGKASTGSQDILDIVPSALHQRIPLIFGSASQVDDIITSLTTAQKES